MPVIEARPDERDHTGAEKKTSKLDRLFGTKELEEPRPVAKTLDATLQDEDAFVAFQSYLDSILASENLLFWMEVELFRLDSFACTRDDSNVLAAQNDIFAKYFDPESPLQVNVPGAVLERLMDEVAMQRASHLIFDETQRSIFENLEQDSFPEFLHSGYFEKYESVRVQTIRRYEKAVERRRRKSALIPGFINRERSRTVDSSGSGHSGKLPPSVVSLEATNVTLIPFYRERAHQYHSQLLSVGRKDLMVTARGRNDRLKKVLRTAAEAESKRLPHAPSASPEYSSVSEEETQSLSDDVYIAFAEEDLISGGDSHPEYVDFGSFRESEEGPDSKPRSLTLPETDGGSVPPIERPPASPGAQVRHLLTTYGSYEARLASFADSDKQYPLRSPSAEALAHAGFYFRPKKSRPDQTRCFSCGILLFRWDPDDDPVQEHKKASPDCSFVSKIMGKEEVASTSPSLFRRKKMADFATFEARLASFADSDKQYPLRSPSAEALAHAGFYFRPKKSRPDQARCFSCGILLFRWDPDDDPVQEHMKASPECPFVATVPRNIRDSSLTTGPSLPPALPPNSDSDGSSDHEENTEAAAGELPERERARRVKGSKRKQEPTGPLLNVQAPARTEHSKSDQESSDNSEHFSPVDVVKMDYWMSDGEIPLSQHKCALRGTRSRLFYTGKLFCTNERLEFLSRISKLRQAVRKPVKKTILWSQVLEITPERTASVIPNAIGVLCVDGRRYTFSSFSSRDRSLDVIKGTWERYRLKSEENEGPEWGDSL